MWACSSDAKPKYSADKTVKIYACKRATNISIIDIENANINDNVDPIQLLKININAIKLINTIWPADMLAYKRIIKENGLIKTPSNSIVANTIFMGNGTPGIQKMCYQ